MDFPQLSTCTRMLGFQLSYEPHLAVRFHCGAPPIQIGCGHMLNLGMVNLTEPSYVSVVGTWNLAELGDATSASDPGLGWLRLQDLKRLVHAERYRVRLVHYGRISCFSTYM